MAAKVSLMRSLPEADMNAGYDLVKSFKETQNAILSDRSSYSYDNKAQTITLADLDSKAVKVIHFKIVGTYDLRSNNWTWAWADFHFLGDVKTFSKELCDKDSYEILKTPSFALHQRKVMDLMSYVAHKTGYCGITTSVMGYNGKKDYMGQEEFDTWTQIYVVFRAEDVQPLVTMS